MTWSWPSGRVKPKPWMDSSFKILEVGSGGAKIKDPRTRAGRSILDRTGQGSEESLTEINRQKEVSESLKSRAHCRATCFRAQRTWGVFRLRPPCIISADDHQSTKCKTSNNCKEFDTGCESKINVPELGRTVNGTGALVFITLACWTIPYHTCRIDYSTKIHWRLKILLIIENI